MTDSIDILSVSVDRVDFAQTLAQIAEWIDDGDEAAPLHQICTVNPEFLIEARRSPQFAAVLERADLCVPDGGGLLWAAKLLGAPMHERVTGSDGIYRICALAAQNGWRVYFLGAASGVAERASQALCGRYPGLLVAGTYSGDPTDADWPEIQQRLQKSKPDILFVAFGHPKQDLWIDQHRTELPVKVAMGIGGAFDFVAGVRRRAPHWMQRLGLEWLFRLVQEPWRWRRMLALPHFVVLVLGQWVRQFFARS